MSEPLNIFVSHASEYGELAMTLKRSLEALEGDEKLDIRVSVTMPGGSDWREWIENNVRSADLFLLLYPDERMDLNWCNYELGRFFDGERHIVCLKNVDIEKPPPVFEPFQAYNGDEEGIFKFLLELFDSETFTPGKRLNPEIGVIGKADYDRAKDVARQLAAEFAKARVREKFYDRRIVISLHHTDKAFDPNRTVVEGNPEGMAVLGLEKGAKISWTEMRASLGPKFEWASQLETSLTRIARGQLPPSLPPFRIANHIYVPVIARSETVDKVLRRLVVIFIAIE
ncbi:MAG: TIR domain-containing protein, partial [Sedimenticolaceae bacterium]